jgi:hypothetical protein
VANVLRLRRRLWMDFFAHEIFENFDRDSYIEQFVLYRNSRHGLESTCIGKAALALSLIGESNSGLRKSKRFRGR